jgi:hypothetical protein
VQELDRLIPFTNLRAPRQAELKRKLDGVAYAFARTGTAQADKGLWGVIQNNMGESVRKDGEHRSYSEFCHMFTETTIGREDHIFLRALDFYGANKWVAVDSVGCAAIIEALNELGNLLNTSVYKA